MGSTQGFLPVGDVFFASSSQEQEAQWHLVTPLMKGGTLQTLAKTIARNQTDIDLSIRTLDIRFRPRLDELLSVLEALHSKGLCHDDLKLDNIFVDEPSTEEDGSWLLGDLGNVRETSHPYHFSRIWTYSNKQLPDCRANDALRMTKTYLQFLRHAVDSSRNTRSGFDKALLEAKEPWARLLWHAHGAGNHLRAESVLESSSGDEHPESPISSVSLAHPRPTRTWTMWLLLPFHGWHSTHERASASALKITASDASAKILGLTWVLGVPVGRC
jgi:serine/threonine protein kinase